MTSDDLSGDKTPSNPTCLACPSIHFYTVSNSPPSDLNVPKYMLARFRIIVLFLTTVLLALGISTFLYNTPTLITTIISLFKPNDNSDLLLRVHGTYLLNILSLRSHTFTTTIGGTQSKSKSPRKMAWRCSGRTNAELIANLFKAQLISSERVKASMTSVDRAHYCRDSSASAAYEDSPQSIGHGATISAPHMHASAAESLLPYMLENTGARVLDVGSGSGYLTHVLANLVCGSNGTGDGKVIGIDHIDELTTMATANMRKSDEGRRLLDAGKVEFITGDGRKGYEAAGPYDAIHVGAAAKELHEELVKQLKSPGRMFIPVEDDDDRGMRGAQYIWVVDKDDKGQVKKRKDMGVRYVPLTDAPR